MQEFIAKYLRFFIIGTVASIAIIIIILISLVIIRNFQTKPTLQTTTDTKKVQELTKIQVKIKGDSVDKTITVEKAVTEIELERGLMDRTSIGSADGMLFVFQDSQYRYFWMKNTKIKLDIIFFDGEGKFISVSRSAEPCPESLGDFCPSYVSVKPAKYVLETNPGFFSDKELNELPTIELVD